MENPQPKVSLPGNWKHYSLFFSEIFPKNMAPRDFHSILIKGILEWGYKYSSSKPTFIVTCTVLCILNYKTVGSVKCLNLEHHFGKWFFQFFKIFFLGGGKCLSKFSSKIFLENCTVRGGVEWWIHGRLLDNYMLFLMFTIGWNEN